jgi:hypothetical protein
VEEVSVEVRVVEARSLVVPLVVRSLIHPLVLVPVQGQSLARLVLAQVLA